MAGYSWICWEVCSLFPCQYCCFAVPLQLVWTATGIGMHHADNRVDILTWNWDTNLWLLFACISATYSPNSSTFSDWLSKIFLSVSLISSSSSVTSSVMFPSTLPAVLVTWNPYLHVCVCVCGAHSLNLCMQTVSTWTIQVEWKLLVCGDWNHQTLIYIAVFAIYNNMEISWCSG